MRKKIQFWMLSVLFCLTSFASEVFAQSSVKTAQSTENKKSPAQSSNSKPKRLTEDEKQLIYMKAADDASKAIRAGQYASALARCEEAMRLDPKHEIDDLTMLCAVLYDKNNDNASAESLIRLLRKKQRGPQMDFDLCFTHATLLDKLHRYTDAISTYRSCVPGSDVEKAVVLSNIAEIEMVMEEPDKAIQTYQQALELKPDNPFAIFGLTVALVRTGRSLEAHEAFVRGLQYDPTLRFLTSSFFEPKAEAYFHKAVLSLFSHRIFDAKFYLEACLKHEVRTKYREITKALLADVESGVYSKAEYQAYPVVLNDITAVAVDDAARFLAFADKQSRSLWVLDTETGRYTERVRGIEDVRAVKFIPQTGMLRAVGKNMRVELDPLGTGYTYYETLPDEAKWCGLTPEGDLLGVERSTVVQAPFRAPLNTESLYAFNANDMEGGRLVDEISISEDKKRLLINLKKHCVQIEIESQNVLGMIALGADVLSMSTTKDVLVLSSSGGAVMYDRQGMPATLIGDVQYQGTSGGAFSPHGRYLLTVSGTLAEIWKVDEL